MHLLPHQCCPSFASKTQGCSIRLIKDSQVSTGPFVAQGATRRTGPRVGQIWRFRRAPITAQPLLQFQLKFCLYGSRLWTSGTVSGKIPCCAEI